MKQKRLTILSPTAILGYGFPLDSFRRGLERKPDLIAVDGGSTDPGPYYLGAGKPFTNRSSVKRDLELMIKAAVHAHIPLVVGTAGGCGARPHVSWCRDIVQEISGENNLRFRLGGIAADIIKEEVLAALRKKRIHPLRGAGELTEEAVHQTTRIVAQMGWQPIGSALQKGCDVVLAGRAYDPAVFAALPILKGFDPGPALHLGKILECAAIAATPGSGADCVLGTLYRDRFEVEALNPERSFTVQSTAAHTLYEKSDPAHLAAPGGVLDLSHASFTDAGDGRVSVQGSRFLPGTPYCIKLEGASRVGFRTISVAGIRDPIMIRTFDSISQKVMEQIAAMQKEQHIRGDFDLLVYGKNGVMGKWEPNRETAAHEVGLVLEAVSPTQAEADSLCSLGRTTLLHYGYPGRIATAGNLAFPFSPSDIPMGEVYRFSIYHLMEADPERFFPVTVQEIVPGEPPAPEKGTAG